MQKRYRNWCFTWNNYPDAEVGANKFWDRFKDLKYGVYQVEKGEETGHFHLQGYLEFSKSYTMATLKKWMDGVHLERRKGTRDEARDYCRKEDTRCAGPFEFGEWTSKQGQRSDLMSIKEAIDAGKAELDIWDAHFDTMVKYPRGIGLYLQIKSPKRCKVTMFEVHCGPPGTGKTTWCIDRYPGSFWKSADEWWDGYNGEKVTLLDEFHGWLPYTVLLRLGDSTPLQLNRKGGRVEFTSEKVVMLSNKMPWKWYKYEELGLDFNALKRRVSKWYFHASQVSVMDFDSFDEFDAFVSTNGYG